uniref:Uncharacterized protein n=1 Tax=Anser brachyrhynchus TaxID=132585 RepID=A0A8B9BEB1_9AVES
LFLLSLTSRLYITCALSRSQLPDTALWPLKGDLILSFSHSFFLSHTAAVAYAQLGQLHPSSLVLTFACFSKDMLQSILQTDSEGGSPTGYVRTALALLHVYAMYFSTKYVLFGLKLLFLLYRECITIHGLTTCGPLFQCYTTPTS